MSALPDYQHLDAEGLAKTLGRNRQRRVSAASNTWLTFCPAHDDRRNPSLQVSDGERTTIFYCWAGCSQANVAAALDRLHIRPQRFVCDSPRPRRGFKPAVERPRPVRAAPAPDEGRFMSEGLARAPYPHELSGEAGYRETARWTWRNSAGAPVMLTTRLEGASPSDKIFRQYSPWMTNGAASWRAKAPPPPRPMFDLHRAFEAPAVLIVEGEKKVAAARRLFGDYFWVTTTGASTSARMFDLAPLLGRAVIIAVDMDGPGLKYASAIAQESAAASIHVLRIPALFNPESGADLDDLVRNGVTTQEYARALRASDPGVLVKIK